MIHQKRCCGIFYGDLGRNNTCYSLGSWLAPCPSPLMNGRTAAYFKSGGFFLFQSGPGLALSLGAIVYHPQDVRKGSLLCWPQSPGPDPSVADSAEQVDSCCLCGSDPEVKGSPWAEEQGHLIPLPGQSFAIHSLSCARTISFSCLCRSPRPPRLSQASSASSGVIALARRAWEVRQLLQVPASPCPQGLMKGPGVCVSPWRPQALAAVSVTEIRGHRVKQQRSCSKWFPGDSFSKH